MKTILLFLVLVPFGYIFGQPVINVNFFPGIGTNFAATTVTNASALLPGGNGGNQTWNFSNASPSGSFIYTNYSGPNGSPYSSQFPGTNFVFSSGTTPNSPSAYFHFIKSATRLDMIGSVAGNNNVVSKLQNPDTQFWFDQPYNQVKSDDFYGSSYILAGPDTVSGSFKFGKSSFVYNAYGTLINPAGTFQNCVRVENRKVSKDSTAFFQFPVTVLVETRTRSYLWLVAGPSVNPFRMSMSYDTVIVSGIPNYYNTVAYTTTTTDVEPEILDGGKWKLFPNPASHYLQFSNQNQEKIPASVAVTGMKGQSYNLPVEDEGRVSISHLPSGLYFLEVSGAGKKSGVRFVKE